MEKRAEPKGRSAGGMAGGRGPVSAAHSHAAGAEASQSVSARVRHPRLSPASHQTRTGAPPAAREERRVGGVARGSRLAAFSLSRRDSKATRFERLRAGIAPVVFFVEQHAG